MWTGWMTSSRPSRSARSYTVVASSTERKVLYAEPGIPTTYSAQSSLQSHQLDGHKIYLMITCLPVLKDTDF